MARNLKAAINDLLQPPWISFPDLAAFLDSIDNMGWFEVWLLLPACTSLAIQAELDLCLRCAVIEALRLLVETGKMESFMFERFKNGALNIAFSEVVKDCVDEKQQYQNYRRKVGAVYFITSSPILKKKSGRAESEEYHCRYH